MTKRTNANYPSPRLLWLAPLLVACGSSGATPSSARSAGGASVASGSDAGVSGSGAGGVTASAGGGLTGNGGVVSAGSPSGGVSANGGTPVAVTDGGASPVFDAASPVFDAALPAGHRMIAGVDVHPYPKPSAYGFVAADGADRMGNALVAVGAPVVRGGDIGDTAFLARLATFGVKDVVLLLSASAEGKPFDPAGVAPLLKKSLDVATPLGLTVRVEGLNEWDLFNTRPYNVGVLPSGMSASEFVLFTQKALYEAAHPLGVTVLGPSVGHPTDAKNVAFFPDVSPYVDVVNAHLYFSSDPTTLPVAAVVASHQHFQGSGKPLWVTETGISSYGNVTPASQADVMRKGLGAFAATGLIARAYVYELLDDQLPGLSGTTYTPESAEYHFGLYTFAGDAKPAAASFRDFAGTP